MRGKKSRPCARILKNKYVHLRTQAAGMPVFHVQRFGTKSERAQFRILSPAGHFVYGGSDDFFSVATKTFQCKLLFEWKVMKLEHMEAI